MAQKHYVEPEENARTERSGVAPVIVQLELADKEKTHAGNTKNNSHQITPMKAFADYERRKNKNVNRGRVLKEDRVGRSGMFCRPNKQKEKRSVNDTRQCTK